MVGTDSFNFCEEERYLYKCQQKTYDQQKCLKIFKDFLVQFVLVKWGDRESWNIYDFNHGKPHLNTSTCPIPNMNNIFHHTLSGTQTFVQKTCFVSDPCRSCLWWHIDLSWSFQVGSNEQFLSFERKYVNEHIHNIILASFLEDFNFLKACSSPKNTVLWSPSWSLNQVNLEFSDQPKSKRRERSWICHSNKLQRNTSE